MIFLGLRVPPGVLSFFLGGYSTEFGAGDVRPLWVGKKWRISLHSGASEENFPYSLVFFVDKHLKVGYVN